MPANADTIPGVRREGELLCRLTRAEAFGMFKDAAIRRGEWHQDDPHGSFGSAELIDHGMDSCISVTVSVEDMDLSA